MMARMTVLYSPLLVLFLAAVFPAVAQQTGSPSDVVLPGKEVIVRRILESRLALTRFRWKVRREIRQNNKMISVRVEEFEVDDDGFFRSTLVSEKPVLKNKKKREAVESVLRLARTYLLPSTLGLEETLNKAMVSPGTGDRAGMTRVQLDSYNQLGDSAVYWIDNKLRRAQRLEVDARLGKKKRKVRIEVEFQPIEGGTIQVGRARVLYPKQDMEIVIEFFDFVHREGSAPESSPSPS